MEYFRIGLIAKPQGIRGELKVNSLSERLDRFLELESVFVEDGNTYTEHRVKGARLGDGCAFLFLERIYSRDEAEKLRNKYLCVDREHLIELPEGMHFIFDLISCRVFGDKGTFFGTVTDVLQPGANDVYVVKNGDKEVLIPAVKAFVTEIDVKEKKITVRENMLEEVVISEDQCTDDLS